MTTPDGEFYLGFEDRFRGSRDLVRQRLEVYLPFLKPLAALKPGCEALDLGCGRCEWLDLLTANGIPACGVDLDEGMMRACREQGYRVETQDALAGLRLRKDNTLIAVSGFHIVEHLQFSVLRSLLAEAHRTLVPGGLLFLETPNPENVVVGLNNFFLDPTHLKPVPQQLLTYLVESTGFRRHAVLRLQEPTLASRGSPDLGSVFWGVSFDYSIVAQKAGDADTTSILDEQFASNRGISLTQAVDKYNQSLETWINHVLRGLAEEMEQHKALAARQRTLLDGTMDQVRELYRRTNELDVQVAVLLNGRSRKPSGLLGFGIGAVRKALRRTAKFLLVAMGRPLYGLPILRRLGRKFLRSKPELLALVVRNVSPPPAAKFQTDLRGKAPASLSPMEQETLARMLASRKDRRKKS